LFERGFKFMRGAEAPSLLYSPLQPRGLLFPFQRFWLEKGQGLSAARGFGRRGVRYYNTNYFRMTPTAVIEFTLTGEMKADFAYDF
jgi:hypothetical protein